MDIKTYREQIQKTIPNDPGVYRYFGAERQILYVGKAKNLRKRVNSYFSKSLKHRRTKALVRKINHIEFTIVDTEKDALLLENSLIKKLQPPYNILLKSDKTYPYIRIRKESFPRVEIARKPTRDGSEFYGPFTSNKRVYLLLDLVHKIFQLRTCNYNLHPTNVSLNKFKVCLQYHIKNCQGPCEGLQDPADYEQKIDQIRRILKGETGEVIDWLENQMMLKAEKFQFEQAQVLKEHIEILQNYQSKSTVVNPKLNNIDVFALAQTERKAYINYFRVVRGSIIQTQILELTKSLDETDEDLLTFGIHEFHQRFHNVADEVLVPIEFKYPDSDIKFTVPKIGDKKKLLDLCQKNVNYYKQQRVLAATGLKLKKEAGDALAHIQKDFHLKERPVHIECIDNSNFQGSFPVASLVVFKNGKPAKSEYRHFNIKTVVGPDDFGSMSEVVLRRYRRLLNENKPLPQLLIVDGGKGQLNAAIKSLEELNLMGKIAVAGIAKKLEEIYLPNDPIPLHIDKKSAGLKVIQRLRNEAHRFAITFHRNKRSKAALTTELTDIEGIGPKTAQNLLIHFKGVGKVKLASLIELETVLNKKQAKAVFEYFQKSNK